jgi:glycosyltransferase involved in cell wall biosynthesis
MKVLHLNANSAGGAFTAANRLSSSLNDQGLTSSHLVFSGFPGTGYELWANNPFRRALAFLNHAAEKLDFLPYEKDSSVRFAFSHGLTGIDITGEAVFREADIIHLHWINKGFISLKGLRKIINSGKPVVWTCHDMWPFTGGCYHNRGCENFKTGCGNCPYLKRPSANDLSAHVFREKQQVFASGNLQFVTPSTWLAAQASSSPIAIGKQVGVIPNGIDTALFQPGDAVAARKKLGIPPQAHVIAFAAASLANPKKGFSEFKALIQSLKNAGIEGLHVLLIGENKHNAPLDFPVPCTFTGYLTKETDMVECYQAASVYVTTSHEENLPTTIMESMACGTPAAAFSVGGIPEMIEDGKNGWLAGLFDIDLLSRKLAGYLQSDESERSEISNAARLWAKERYAHSVVAGQYKVIYEKLLK